MLDLPKQKDTNCSPTWQDKNIWRKSLSAICQLFSETITIFRFHQISMNWMQSSKSFIYKWKKPSNKIVCIWPKKKSVVAAHTTNLALCLLLFGFEHHISNKHAEEAKKRHKSKHRNQNGVFLRQKVLVHKMISINEWQYDHPECIVSENRQADYR